ncbi:YqhR family membrane protein [Virgibacillus halodenitrificans]|uniref:YqhR family membrane protein n=1 Tax=Virgibacillus halodenitrificans TaxID=1482 RepID=UPI000EF461F8|nr:YqhR family membrane protein [Virgibacillus halodenitrificans]
MRFFNQIGNTKRGGVFYAGRKKLEQNKREEPMSLLSRSLLTGFIGGLLFGSLGMVMYYFNFSEVSPKSYVLRSWVTEEWTEKWLGNIIAILLLGILSVLIAMCYYGLLRKIYSLWAGVLFGIILWGLCFYLFQPIFPNIPELSQLTNHTIVSTICLFVIYGSFVGYSISYDYYDTKMREANG